MKSMQNSFLSSLLPGALGFEGVSNDRFGHKKKKKKKRKKKKSRKKSDLKIDLDFKNSKSLFVSKEMDPHTFYGKTNPKKAKSSKSKSKASKKRQEAKEIKISEDLSRIVPPPLKTSSNSDNEEKNPNNEEKVCEGNSKKRKRDFDFFQDFETMEFDEEDLLVSLNLLDHVARPHKKRKIDDRYGEKKELRSKSCNSFEVPKNSPQYSSDFERLDE